MRKLQLAVFNTQPPLYLGGVERRILETAKRLQPKIDTTVYSGTKAGLRKPTQLDGLKVVPCFSTDTVFPLDNWTFNQTLARNANTIKADVYEAHTASGYELIKAFKKKKLKIPFVQTIHGVLADEYAQAILQRKLSFRQKLANLLMWQLAKKEEESANNATLIMTISKYSKSKITQFYDVDPTKIRIVSNGVDPERFTPEGDCEKIRRYLKAGHRQCVLFVGSLIPRKGLNYLIQAAKEVIKENQHVLFIIIGGGPLQSRLLSDVAAAGIAKNFALIRGVTEQNLPGFYRCADVFVLPSIQEGQGIVLLEAQSSATPVVAFNVSGVSEAVRNGETGLLVKPNSEELAEAILRLLSDASMRKKMGFKGREFVKQNFTWDICAEKITQVYREALSTT